MNKKPEPPKPKKEQPPREEPKMYPCPTCNKMYRTAAGAQNCYSSH